MKKQFDKINIWGLIITFIHFVVTFFTDKNIFLMNSLNIKNYIFCKILLFFILYFLWQFISKVIQKNKTAVGYFKWFLIYIIPIAILLLFAWPGTWYGSDVNNFYNLSIQSEYLYSLSYLSSVFYIVGYMIFPCVSGAIILQCIVFGMVFSYISHNLYKKYNSKWILVMIIPFMLPHTVFYTFYANRPVMYGIFYLLLISILIIDYINNENITIGKTITLSLLTGIVSNWRSEAIYLFLIIPIFMFIVYKFKMNFINLFKLFGICLFAFIIISIPQKIGNKKNEIDFFSRNMPMFVNPLSYMLVQDGFQITEEEYKNINRVLDIESMKKYSSYKDTPCGWLGGCIKGYDNDETLKQFLNSYLSVIKKNSNLFIRARYLTFQQASSKNGDYFSSKKLYSSNNDMLFEQEHTKTIFHYKTRAKLYTLLEGNSYNYNVYNKLTHFVGSLQIPLTFIIILFVYSLYKKNILYFLISGMLLGHTLIVFFTAPAAYFMYYFNVYMCGWFLGLFMMINIIFEKKLKKLK